MKAKIKNHKRKEVYFLKKQQQTQDFLGCDLMDGLLNEQKKNTFP